MVYRSRDARLTAWPARRYVCGKAGNTMLRAPETLMNAATESTPREERGERYGKVGQRNDDIAPDTQTALFALKWERLSARA